MPANVRKRPTRGSATGRVWEIADEILRQTGAMPSGREVVNRYVAEGGNEGTGFTQFSHWKRVNGPVAQAAGRPEARGPSPAWLTISPDGRLAMPPQVQEAMRLDGSRKVHAEVVEGELRLASVPVVIERLQRFASQFKTEGESVVDEFIAERRAEAERG